MSISNIRSGAADGVEEPLDPLPPAPEPPPEPVPDPLPDPLPDGGLSASTDAHARPKTLAASV
ncbi:MAG: hypothetical protein ACC655_09455, partial [Rhodothermia bacterium]